jgi:hypothetical protein
MRNFYYKQNMSFGLLLSIALIFSALKQRPYHAAKEGTRHWTTADLNTATLHVLKVSASANPGKACNNNTPSLSDYNSYTVKDIRSMTPKAWGLPGGE